MGEEQQAATGQDRETEGEQAPDRGAEADHAIRHLPVLDPENRAFWSGGANDQLLIARCGQCLHYIHPPRPRCHLCGSTLIDREAVSGRGRVKTFTVNRQPWLPGLKVPYILAAVELEEQQGLHVISNIVGCPAESVYIGMPVRVEFEQAEDVWIPLFHPGVEGR